MLLRDKSKSHWARPDANVPRFMLAESPIFLLFRSLGLSRLLDLGLGRPPGFYQLTNPLIDSPMIATLLA